MSSEFMMARRGAMAFLMGSVAVLCLGGCGSRRRFNYKMTVEVDRPQGLRTGFAVREITKSRPSNLPSIGESRPQWRIRGEAVAVDLPGGRTLFALLKGANSSVDYAAFDVDILFKEHGDAAPQGVVELWPAMPETLAPRLGNPLPMLVTFGDLTDPKSVERVDPANLAATFGPGMRLRRIVVETTSDDVTTGIEERLGWLGSFPEPSLNPAHGPKDFSLAATLHHGDFRRGTES